MADDIIVRWGIEGCDQYRGCKGPERCPVLTSINYLVQEHEVTHLCSLKYRIDATRRKDRPYCSFLFISGSDQPAMDELKREIELTVGPLHPEAAD